MKNCEDKDYKVLLCSFIQLRLYFRSGMEELNEKMLGPYFHGLGNRKKISEAEVTSDENGSENNEYFFSRRGKVEPPTKQRVNHLDAEVIPKFDPGKKTTNVKGWLHKIDQLGDMYQWEERDRIFVMQLRLRGAARDWYDDLDDYGTSWTVWKEKLSRAFPRSTDFVDRLEEMLKRTKDNSETMTKYFHEKMSLLKKCDIEGDAATSCLIRGLPVELRANAKAYNCETPEELYYGFLSSLENYKKVETRSAELRSTWQRGSNMPNTCFNCHKTGHEARDCRLTCCEVCQRVGHAAAACWYAARTSSAEGPYVGNPASGSFPGTADLQKDAYAPRNIQQIQRSAVSIRDRRGTRPMQDGRV